MLSSFDEHTLCRCQALQTHLPASARAISIALPHTAGQREWLAATSPRTRWTVCFGFPVAEVVLNEPQIAAAIGEIKPHEWRNSETRRVAHGSAPRRCRVRSVIPARR